MRDAPPRELIVEYGDRLGVPVDAEQADAVLGTIEMQSELLSRLDDVGPDRPRTDRDYWRPDTDDDPYGAFITRCAVSRASGGPLEGMTVGVKDNMAVAGVPMTVGSPSLEGYVPSEDATIVERLLDAGATIAGKTNMDEFASGGDESSMRFRLARNPRDPEHMPGGSSSGSAVAVANGDVDVAIGSDGGGSIRAPAGWCGIVGVKPTRGLVSHYGCFQYAKNLDNHAPMARTAMDAARTLEVIAGADPRDERTKGVEVGDYATAASRDRDDLEGVVIGLPEELFGTAPDVDDVVLAALERLEDDGARLREVSIDGFEYGIPAWLAFGIAEMGAFFRSRANNYWLLSQSDPLLNEAFHEALTERAGDIGDSIVNGLLAAEFFADAKGERYYPRAHRARRLVTDAVDDVLSSVDVLASATMPMVAPAWGDNVYEMGLEPVLKHTAPFNLTGHPAISVPCGEHDGLPVGMQFVANSFDEETMFRVAARWETIREADGA